MMMAGCDEYTEREAPLSEPEFIANMFIPSLDGYETAANGLCGALMLLGQHPERQVQLREQLVVRLGGGPRASMRWPTCRSWAR